MWDIRHALDSLIWEAALDDMGIYPRAVVTDGVETPRTPWQDGWNAAVIDLTAKHGAMTKWVKSLDDEQQRMLGELLDDDSSPVMFGYKNGAPDLALNCNDTFCYACADAESFEIADLPEIYRLWKAHGYYGTTAWIARKRHAEPVKEYRIDNGYLKAKADL